MLNLSGTFVVRFSQYLKLRASLPAAQYGNHNPHDRSRTKLWELTRWREQQNDRMKLFSWSGQMDMIFTTVLKTTCAPCARYVHLTNFIRRQKPYNRATLLISSCTLFSRPYRIFNNFR